MISVSSPSFDTYARQTEDQFVARLARYLTDSVPQLANAPIAQHRELTRQVIEQARAHGFVNEVDIACYGLCAALLGLDFPAQFPGAREILEMTEPAPYRARLLEHFTRELFELLES